MIYWSAYTILTGVVYCAKHYAYRLQLYVAVTDIAYPIASFYPRLFLKTDLILTSSMLHASLHRQKA